MARIFTFSVSDMVREGLLFRSEFCYKQRCTFRQNVLYGKSYFRKSLFSLHSLGGKQIKGIKLGVGVFFFFNKVSAMLINTAKFSSSSILFFN